MTVTYSVDAATSAVPQGYKQTDVGVIPEDWLCADIGALNPFVTSGSRGWAEFYSEYGQPFVRITNTKRHSIYLDLSDLKFVKLPETSSEGKRTSLVNGDVLISITADIGISSYVDDSLVKPAYINQHIALVRFNPDEINSKFVAYFLSSENVQKLFRSTSDQGAKAGLNLDSVRKIQIALPSKSEQTTIANALSDVDALIQEMEKLIAKKQAIKTATMQQLLTGRTRLPPFGFEKSAHHPDGRKKGYKSSELGEIPEDWEFISIGRDTVLKARIGWQALTTKEYQTSGDIFLVTGTDFDSGEVKWERCFYVSEWRYRQDQNIQLKNHDVLITKDGTIGKVGYVAALSRPATLNSGIFVVRPKNNKLMQRFLFYVLTSRVFDDFINRITAGSTITHLYQKDFVNFEFPAPCIQEQGSIATILSDIDEEILALEQRLNKTRQIKQGMMQELLTGKTRLVKPAGAA
ncbi:restriction endonuclease subunit S [Vibrio cholerae]|nr:restriction endonuclease subunit S [Vibrio cholerae]EJL3955511.1 restriction endonuclease subunit S [Vibrio cholerae]EKI0758802.1 restriction endonuclease subunit S [Vibrio cholerae]